MKRVPRTKTVLVLGMIISLSLACQLASLTPEQILAKAKQNMSEVQTYQMEMDLTMSMMGSTLSLTALGYAENPDKAYMTMEILGEELEILMLGTTEAYTRMSGQEAWTPMDPAALSESTGLSTAASQLQITDYASNIVRQEDEEIDGVKCYHLTMDVDAAKMLDVVNPGLADQVTLGSEPATMELWVGTGDLLIYKMTYALSMTIQGEDVDMSMLITFSAFGEAVEFPSP